jgi:hypothetical protein
MNSMSEYATPTTSARFGFFRSTGGSGLQPFVVDGQGTVRDTLVTCERCLGLVVE